MYAIIILRTVVLKTYLNYLILVFHKYEKGGSMFYFLEAGSDRFYHTALVISSVAIH